jgi:hypothetical protein
MALCSPRTAQNMYVFRWSSIMLNKLILSIFLTYIHTYIYIHTHTHIYIYIHAQIAPKAVRTLSIIIIPIHHDTYNILLLLQYIIIIHIEAGTSMCIRLALQAHIALQVYMVVQKVVWLALQAHIALQVHMVVQKVVWLALQVHIALQVHLQMHMVVQKVVSLPPAHSHTISDPVDLNVHIHTYIHTCSLIRKERLEQLRVIYIHTHRRAYIHTHTNTYTQTTYTFALNHACIFRAKFMFC